MNDFSASCDPKPLQDTASKADQAAAARTGKPFGSPVVSDDSFLSTPQQSGSEEPDLALELDLPSDGRDLVGEAMIRDLPQRPELSKPSSPSKQPT